MNRNFKIMDLFARIIDLLLLNVLFIVTSLPIITIGASLCALYSTNLKMVRGEESYIIKNYLHAFRINFKQSVPSFALFLLGFCLLGTNLYISFNNSGTFFLVLRGLSSIFMLTFYIYFLYYFPILARFQFTCRQVLLHIPHMIFSHPGYFISLIILNIPVIILCTYSLYTAGVVILITYIIGASTFTYVESILFRKIFENYEIAAWN